jgi:hypothetical protein
MVEDLTSSKAVPGPGTYKIKAVVTPVGAILGSESRMPKDHSSRLAVPGPGAYKLRQEQILAGGVISEEKRFKYKSNGVPGPGAYKIPGMMGYLNI